MEGYLYRYIGFDSFVNMIQTQSLTFVLPYLWEDTYEMKAFYTYVMKRDNFYFRCLLYAIKYKIYAQCWTKLAESDAMWRIYNYSNKALRIKTNIENIQSLADVDIQEVIYCDDVQKMADQINNDNFNQIIALKRMAFSHEEEVRLIWRYKFKDNDDAERHIRSVIGLTFTDLSADSEEGTVRKIIDSFAPNNPKKAVEEIVKITNANAAVKTKQISFAGINNFIQGVEVHPLAPEWYVRTVEQYCMEHKVFFEGKSKLYINQTE